MPLPRNLEERIAYLKVFRIGYVAGVIASIDPAGVACHGPDEYRTYAEKIVEELDSRDKEQTHGRETATAETAVHNAFGHCGYGDAFIVKAGELISYLI